MTAQKHLIIGAGFVGLGFARALERDGIPYDQVDARSEVGGNWLDGVYNHVHIISSRRTTEFTDFPMPADYPDFPSAAQMLSYLKSYADHFGLRAHMELGKTVTRVVPTVDERWSVEFADGTRRIYKGVLVCNGHHFSPHHPSYPGTFTGEYLHSKQYKSERMLAGRRVLVIGGGNSACDIAVDAARVAAESCISVRRGYWFLPKSVLGIPTVEIVRPWVPVWVQRLLVRALVRLVFGRYRDYGLPEPDHRVFEAHPTLNTLLLYYIKHGVITPKPAIARFDGRAVEFSDGSRREFDMVVAATGYDVVFPFLPPGLVRVERNIPQIPEGTFHPRHKGLYILGWQQARYGVGPLVTAGARAFTEVLKVQDELVRPVGMVLEKLGVRPPPTHLVDPMKSLKAARKGVRGVHRLPLLEKVAFRGRPYVPAPVDQYAEPEARAAAAE
jgi:hypothetical protein